MKLDLKYVLQHWFYVLSFGMCTFTKSSRQSASVTCSEEKKGHWFVMVNCNVSFNITLPFNVCSQSAKRGTSLKVCVYCVDINRIFWIPTEQCCNACLDIKKRKKEKPKKHSLAAGKLVCLRPRSCLQCSVGSNFVPQNTTTQWIQYQMNISVMGSKRN